MAMSLSSNNYNRQNWEDSDFPILCQTCLGDNPYIRMMKEKFGRECKICNRPFTIFRWCPGAKMRYKKTEVCQTCSKMKNICQTCLLDLEYGLPVQVRDRALKLQDSMPRSEVNKEYYTQNTEKELANTDGTVAAGALGKAHAPSDLLLKLARTAPYYKRNRPHICSFWVKGECKRGEECPYRHEKPTDPDDPLADQNIKDRFYGVNDPVADKLMRRFDNLPKLEPPEDRTVTTLYIGNVTDDITDPDLRDFFYQFGELRSVSMVPRQQCAFIEFTTRSSAEAAAEKIYNKLIVKGHRLTVRWGRSQGQLTASRASASASSSSAGEGADYQQMVSLPGVPGVSSEELSKNYFNLGPSTGPMMVPRALPPPPMMGGPPHLPPGMRMPPPHMMMRGPPPPGMMPVRPPPMPGFMPGPPPPGGHVPPPHELPPPIHYPSQDPTRLGGSSRAGPVE